MVSLKKKKIKIASLPCVALFVFFQDICIPMNSTQFVLVVSEQLAVKESHLTLEVSHVMTVMVVQLTLYRKFVLLPCNSFSLRL